LVLETEIENIKKLEEQINLQQDRDYFFCPKKCIEAPFEVAAAYDFKCPNCGKNLEMTNIKHIKHLKKKHSHTTYRNLNKILENIENESGYLCA
jgi:transcription initiation factor TFIIE subunit alpha